MIQPTTAHDPGTPTHCANLDIETSTIGSSDHWFSSKTDQSTGDEDMSQTEYDDSDTDRGNRNPDDEGFFESDASSTISLTSTVEEYFRLYNRQYPNADTGYS
jgi:hypothetical protein